MAHRTIDDRRSKAEIWADCVSSYMTSIFRDVWDLRRGSVGRFLYFRGGDRFDIEGDLHFTHWPWTFRGGAKKKFNRPVSPSSAVNNDTVRRVVAKTCERLNVSPKDLPGDWADKVLADIRKDRVSKKLERKFQCCE